MSLRRAPNCRETRRPRAEGGDAGRERDETMTAATPLLLLLISSIWLIVLSLGARASVDDVLYVLRRRDLLLRAILAIFIVVPVVAVAVCAFTGLAPEIKVALVTLSVAPVPPILPTKQIKAGASSAYVIGLLVAAAVASIVLTPILVEIAAKVLGATAAVSPGQVAKTLLISIGLPLALGVALHRFAPRLAPHVQHYAMGVGAILLLAGLVIILVHAWPGIVELVGDGSVLAIALMSIVGLAAGHLLGGDEIGDRAALAFAAATRHPGVAFAIITASYPDRRQDGAAAILLYILVNLVVTTPYLIWMRRRTARAG
jgi:BASS family bile acid:Na+ symporter